MRDATGAAGFGSVLMALLAAVFPAFEPAIGAEPSSREYAIKAAFLYKFADYIEWPASAFASAGSPLSICVIGEDPFGAALDSLAAGERAAGRVIAVRHLPTPEGAANCNVAYVGARTPDELARMLAAFAGKPVLTVTDEVDEARPHGIVNFVLRDNHVRFDIDARLAADDRLAISSKLLSIAVAVRATEDSKGGRP